MITITPRQAQERFQNLPTPLQDAIFSVEVATIISDISEKFHLGEVGTSAIAKATSLVLLGFIHPDAVRQELAERVKAGDEALAGVTLQIEDRILGRFRGLLINAFYSQPGPTSDTMLQDIAPTSLENIAPETSPSSPEENGGGEAERTARQVDFSTASMSDIQPLTDLKPSPDTSATPASASSPDFDLPLPTPGENQNPSGNPFILRQEEAVQPVVGDFSFGNTFGVDSSDQFQKKDSPAGTAKFQPAEIEFSGFSSPAVNFTAEEDLPPPPAR